jgi:chemotaxis protein methyltransferase CheR
VTPLDYDYLRKLLKDRSGLMLSADKQYLVESRLTPLARKGGVASLGELVQKLKANNERLIADVVEAMTTNESFFYRDKVPFDHFRDAIMPSMLAARARERRVRIWCAAASTGQEPYSLAMCLKEMKEKVAGWRTDILATDLSTEVLEKAKAGLYSQFEVQRGLPIQMLVKYFTQTGDAWQISPEIRAMVQYRALNLLADFSHLGGFDVVFCRNVLIYFDQETKIGVLNRIAKMLEPDGFLVLGAAETVVGLTDAFKPLADRRGLYAPNKDALKLLTSVPKPVLARPLAAVPADKPQSIGSAASRSSPSGSDKSAIISCRVSTAPASSRFVQSSSLARPITNAVSTSPRLRAAAAGNRARCASSSAASLTRRRSAPPA